MLQIMLENQAESAVIFSVFRSLPFDPDSEVLSYRNIECIKHQEEVQAEQYSVLKLKLTLFYDISNSIKIKPGVSYCGSRTSKC